MDQKSSVSKSLPVPKGRVQRASGFGKIALRFASTIVLDGTKELIGGRPLSLKNLLIQEKNIGVFINELAKLRGAALKIGQLLSLEANDFLPEKFSAMLGDLRNKNFHMPNYQLGEVLRENYGDIDTSEYTMTDEERASNKAEFNETMAGMFNSDFDMQRVLMSRSAQRFREAGVSEVQIAKFTAEQKKQIAVDELNFKLGTVSNLTGALGQLNQASKGSALVSKRLAQTTAIIDTYAGANKALASSPPPFNFVAAGAVVAAGLANVATIESQKFADGGIVQGNPSQGDVNPAMLTAGEVILNQSQQENLVGGMGGITLNISAPLVDETIVDTIIPAIQSALNEDRASLNL